MNEDGTMYGKDDRQPGVSPLDLSDDEVKKAESPVGELPVLSADEDSSSSIDLQQSGTGAVVLPWRVKVPALVFVIFFTRKHRRASYVVYLLVTKTHHPCDSREQLHPKLLVPAQKHDTEASPRRHECEIRRHCFLGSTHQRYLAHLFRYCHRLLWTLFWFPRIVKLYSAGRNCESYWRPAFFVSHVSSAS